MLSPARTPVLRYGGAVLAVILAAPARLALDPLFGAQYPLLTFFAALVFAAWFGGFGPSLLALALSGPVIPYFILPPHGVFPLGSTEAQVRFTAFPIVGLVIAVMGGTIRAARLRAEVAAEEDREKQRRLEREVIERRGAEAALRVEKERLRVTLASIGDAVIVTDAAGRASFLNPVAEALTGWSTSEASGQPLEAVFRVMNQETGQPVESPALQALREETTVGLGPHTVLIARDGSERPIDDSAAPIRDESGQIVGVVLVFRDVTERRRAEEVRSHLAAIVESSDDAILGTTLDGTITSGNSGAERLYGYAAEELIGQSAALLIPADRLEEFHATLDRIHHGLNSDHFESKRRRKDGTLIDVSVKISPIRNGLETVVGASTVAHDITRKKRIEHDLRESEERFSRFMQHLPGLAWIKDLEGRYLYANEAALKAFQMPRSDLYGKVDEEVFPPETAALFRENDRRALSGEAGVQAVETLLQDDGIVHYSLVSKFPVLGQDGKVTLIGGIAIDITERMRMEESLREADRRKDEFLATLAHELRNPLAPIRNALHLMKPSNRDGDDSEARAGDGRAAGDPPGPAGRRPDGRGPDQPGQDRTPQGGRGPGHDRGSCGRGRAVIARGARAHLVRLPAGRVDPPGGRPDEAGAGPREPAEQRGQVHRAGRPDHAGRRARRGARWSCGCGTRASASSRRCCPQSSTCSSRPDTARAARRAAWGSA